MTNEKETITVDENVIQAWIENHPILAKVYAQESKSFQEFCNKIIEHKNKGGSDNE